MNSATTVKIEILCFSKNGDSYAQCPHFGRLNTTNTRAYCTKYEKCLRGSWLTSDKVKPCAACKGYGA